ncbi:Hypothetical protein GbCGDNIH9_8048 [Granulibacter bethesdensis]|uniref:Uncharacterized protein n=1 Tax=Granulibacter bethesdensis TaxID=364410 RepID=A0AAC9KAI3_9PROT|nr:Hypothetical protein GbCGDNIH9_8048 [Granulibacter bethesdensis]APH62276.1 Hypothetical protein GbCGDNIH8_8048 [Granulibacter bethesdensis]
MKGQSIQLSAYRLSGCCYPGGVTVWAVHERILSAGKGLNRISFYKDCKKAKRRKKSLFAHCGTELAVSCFY